MAVVAAVAVVTALVVVAVLVMLVVQQLVEAELFTDPGFVRRAGGDVEQQAGVDAPVAGRVHRDLPDQFGDLGPQPFQGIGFDAVGLVQHHQIRHAQVRRQLRVQLAAVGEVLGIDHLDQPAVADARIVAVHHHANEIARLGQSAGLHHDDVDLLPGMGQPVEQFVQFAHVHRAAHAAVAERHHGVDLPGHQHGVDIHRAEVVDHHPDPRVPRPQQPVEQRRLPGTEESGHAQDRDTPTHPDHPTDGA